jgi:lipopolysaccharide export system protein LptA
MIRGTMSLPVQNSVPIVFSLFQRSMTVLRLSLVGLASLVVALSGVSMAQELTTPLEGPSNDDGLITIESDSQTADNVTGVVTAIGNVRIVYPSRGMVATSRQAQYFSREGRLVLSGDVDVVQEDGSSLRAERVTYDLEDERALALPVSGGQVRSTMILRPDQSAQTPLTP